MGWRKGRSDRVSGSTVQEETFRLTMTSNTLQQRQRITDSVASGGAETDA